MAIVEAGVRSPNAPASARPSQAAHQLALDPFAPGAHGRELLARRIILAPLVVSWQYRVPDIASFRGWIGTKEILLSAERMARDHLLAGVVYGGTYRMSGGESGTGVACRTLWGYTSEAAMMAVQLLGSGDYERATLIQLELIDFLKGLKAHIADGGDQHFTQDVMIATML